MNTVLSIENSITNPYTDQSVAYRRYYGMGLPKPADVDTNIFSRESIIWHHFYGIGMPSPADPPSMDEEPRESDKPPVEKEPETVAPLDHL